MIYLQAKGNPYHSAPTNMKGVVLKSPEMKVIRVAVKRRSATFITLFMINSNKACYLNS